MNDKLQPERHRFRQWLRRMFVCVDCGHITLSGWKCKDCGSRLCFECAGGMAMYSLHSPGFETCRTCKEIYAQHLHKLLAEGKIKLQFASWTPHKQETAHEQS